jgi:MoaA/NifB/PqqE/SkfB family radical SAM enzyme
MQLQLETTSYCNAKCCFCVYPSLKRQKGTMDDALFEKIIDDAVNIPIIDHVTLNGLGEPLLDKKILKRIKYARKAMPGAIVDLYTNGSMLNSETNKRLKEAGLTRIFISLNAARTETRNQIMNLNDYDSVVRSITEIEALGLDYRVLVTYSKDLMEQRDIGALEFMFGKERLMPHMEGNWAGKLYTPRIQQTEPCGRIIGSFMVLWDGRVSLCCQDGEGEIIFGDMNKQSIREVYNSELFMKYREFHMLGKRAELKLCNICTSN